MAMDDNPYAAPRHPSRAPVGLRSGKQQDIRPVAVYQKAIVICILIYFGVIGLNVALTVAGMQIPPIVALALLALIVVNVLAGVVFVFLLAMKVYNPVLGVFMAILTFVPLLGLLILLLVSSRATKILQANGYKVGLLGTDLSEIPK